MTDAERGQRRGLNRALKVVLGLIAAAVIVFVLFEYVFPWVDDNFIANPTLESAPATVGAVA